MLALHRVIAITGLATTATAIPGRTLPCCASSVHYLNSHARDGGCTRPNCLAPGYHSEVHHSPDWAAGGATDADSLFFACAPDHRLVTNGHHQTTVTDTGRLAWTDGTTPPKSTTPTTPKNSSAATPTHPTTTRTDKNGQLADGLGAHRLSGQP